ncbi:MAG: hybrid sensor histidine kinase/response regulator [Elainellaceae cyanobacterium]
MNAFCIRDFIDQLPTCMQVGALTDLVVKFGQSPQGGQIVILDTFQRPLGLAKAQRWLPYFSALEQSGQSSQPLHLYPSRYREGESVRKRMDDTARLRSVSIDSRNVSDDQESQAAPLQQIMATVTLETPIYEFIHKVYAETGQLMLDPVAIAPNYWSLQEFQQNLYQQNFSFSRCPLQIEPGDGEFFRDDEAPHALAKLLKVHQMAHPQSIQWVVVDECDRYLGAIDFGHLWQRLFSQTAAVAEQPSTSEKSTSERVSPQTSHHSAPAPLPKSKRSLFLETLDDLPLPLMVQTTDGAIVAQNQTWRSQMAELADANGLWQQIAYSLQDIFSAPDASQDTHQPGSAQHTLDPLVDAALNSSSSYPALDSPLHEDQIYQQNSDASRSASEEDGFSRAIALPTANGQSTADSCLCLCTLKNGQERVWQFHRVKMRSASPSVSHSPGLGLETPNATGVGSVTHANRSQEVKTEVQPSDPSSPFHLAPLISYGERFHQTQAAHSTQPLWLIHVQDITEQRQTLKELAARNADLTQTNRLKDEFLACITHELKTPLTSILGLSGLMKDQAIGTLNSRQQRYIKLIHHSGRRLVFIVNDILDLTRIETGQVSLNSSPIEIRDVCEQAYKEALQARLYSQNAELVTPAEADADFEEGRTFPSFHLEIQPGLQQVIADELRLRQILSHLLSNALKFTSAGGEIGLRVHLWDNWVTFTVWDTGIGIPNDKQHLIFQRFQQLEDPMTRQFEGTGLGLVLAQKLAQLHGGDLTFTSKEDEGSQFTLLLPPRPLQPEEAWAMNPVANSSVVSPSRSSESGSSESGSSESGSSESGDRPEITPSPVNRLIVIVEADRQLIEHLVKQVTTLGYRAVIARSGTEAIGKIRRLQPRIVLLNSVLPLLSGWDVLTLLKADVLTRHIPLVVMASALESAKATENKADGILTHPIHPNEIQRVINQVSAAQEIEPSIEALTVLYLNPEHRASSSSGEGIASGASGEDDLALTSPGAIALDTQTLNILLHPYRCRFIEVDDLDQAELLSRVWKPDIMLLGEPFPQPEEVLASLSQRLSLSHLPIVTLGRGTTQVANRTKNLNVFPCLDPMQVPTGAEPNCEFGLSSLLQVIQIATGIQWLPHIVVTHSDYLLHRDVAQVYDPGYMTQPVVNRRLQVSSQYFRAAGLRSSVITDFSDMTQRIDKKNVDVLLLCCAATRSSLDSLLLKLKMLAQLDPLMPILIWLDESSQAEPTGAHGLTSSDSQELDVEATLKSLVSDVLPAKTPINDVFAAVNGAIARRIHA